MKLFILCVTLFLLDDSAFANNIVKTLSGQCGEDPAFKGSGYAFSYRGQSLVLTSEHVLVHDRGQAGVYCHGVQWEDGTKSQAEVLAVDWGSGLGLLKLSAIHHNLPDFSEIRAQNIVSIAEGTEVAVAGFPYRSSNLYRDERGAILKLKSERHLFPLVPGILEITRGHGEFGMSGGPVFDRQSGKLLGILSHQILRVTEGGDSQVESPEEDSGVGYNHLLAIPVDYIEAWTKQALDSNFAASFVRNPLGQITRAGGLETAGLIFHSGPQSFPKIKWFYGGEDGAGIGGQPGPENSVMIQVNSSAQSAFATKWYLPARKSLYEDIRQFVLKRSDVSIPYVLKRNGPEKEIRKIYFRSMEGFFQLLNDPEIFVPLLVHGGTNGGLPERVQKIRTASAKLGELVKKVSENPKLSLQGKALLQRLSLIQELSGGENWTFLTKGDLQRVADTNGVYKEAWRELFSLAFDDSVDLLRAVNSLACLIAYQC